MPAIRRSRERPNHPHPYLEAYCLTFFVEGFKFRQAQFSLVRGLEVDNSQALHSQQGAENQNQQHGSEIISQTNASQSCWESSHADARISYGNSLFHSNDTTTYWKLLPPTDGEPSHSRFTSQTESSPSYGEPAFTITGDQEDRMDTGI
ncbi:hypothetical protein NLI96_g5182 [Meripilus lineatus]|uniref:Uncharacterized protein n=1 Tax=Meripilus lineatus TaxID=2056292 RepID=A0AAD5V3H6_9APHY|nr:hypothetical protein NLI96_g5182 [Physisporinus lineatus]